MLIIIVVLFAACAPSMNATLSENPIEVEVQVTQNEVEDSQEPESLNLNCDPEPIVIPTLPAEIPAGLALDEATGLHMTGKPQVIDLESYRLRIFGNVKNEISLSYDQLRFMPKVTDDPSLNCPGAFVDKAQWSGVPLSYLLDLAEVGEGATELWLKSVDGYLAIAELEDSLRSGAFLAYELEGQTLPVIHGFPLRAVFPGEFGSNWVKWLVEIEIK